MELESELDRIVKKCADFQQKEGSVSGIEIIFIYTYIHIPLFLTISKYGLHKTQAFGEKNAPFSQTSE